MTTSGKGLRLPRAMDSLAALGCALPFPMISLVVRYGPSTTDPCTSPLLLSGAPWLAALGLALVALPALAVLSAPSPRAFIARCVVLCVLAVVGSAAFGSIVHRDYFSGVFQYILAFLALYLYYLRSRPLSQVRYETFRSVGRAGYAAFFLLSAWIMLMGYAISTRAEPRPIESVIYNSYNALLDIALLLASRELVLRSFKTLSLGKGGAVFLDGAPIAFVLGAAGIRILRTFLSSQERKATCADIGKAASDEGRGKRRADCSSCDAESAKASLCPEYRATYNRVLELKKLLEFLEVGTILPPKNKRRVLAEGWKLLLFENVRLKLEEGKPEEGARGEGDAQTTALRPSDQVF